MTKARNPPAGRPRRAADADRPPRVGGMREIGALLPAVGGVAFRRFGFSHAALLGRWAEIVGPVYARWSVPESIRHARGSKTAGTLTVRVEGPFSVQLQHVAPQIVERVNRILGHGAVARLKLVHGEVPRRAEAPPRDPAGDALVPVGGLEGVKDAGLRTALEELARMLAAGARPPTIG